MKNIARITLMLGVLVLVGAGCSTANKATSSQSATIANSTQTQKVQKQSRSLKTTKRDQKNTSGRTVTINGHTLPQKPLVIEVGDTVTWTNRDEFTGLPYDAHSITSGKIAKKGSPAQAGVMPKSGYGIADGMYEKSLGYNDSYSYTFTEPGEFTFYIAEHPVVSGEGRIVVKEKKKVQEINMKSGSFFFSPNAIQAKVGEPIKINIDSVGLHTFTIDELGVDVTTPNGKTVVEFTPDKAGTFEFYCDISGHRSAGQVGTIVVTE